MPLPSIYLPSDVGYFVLELLANPMYTPADCELLAQHAASRALIHGLSDSHGSYPIPGARRVDPPVPLRVPAPTLLTREDQSR